MRSATPAKKEPRKVTVITVNPTLHAALKAKAEREGRILQRMCEEKLGEFFAATQLELVESDSL